MAKVKSEDTLIFLAIDPKVTNYDLVIEGLNQFFQKKHSIDQTDRFNVISFVEHGPIYFEDFTFNGNYVVQTFKEFKSQISSINTTGGFFVAITFIIQVFQQVAGKCFRLIVIMDKKTPPLVNIEVLEDLLNKVLEFPFIIDIIRINTDDPREDVKLMKFVKSSGGSVYFAKNEKEANKILVSLAEKKSVKSEGMGDKKEITISEENEMFFENMAMNPVPVLDDNPKNRCQICGEKNDLYKCPTCDSISHRECLAQWCKYSNIGLPHLFRCMNCFHLLKLDKDLVEMAILGVKKSKKAAACEDNIDTWFDDQYNKLLQKDGEKKIVYAEDPMPIDSLEEEDKVFDLANDIGNVEIIICPNCGKLTTTEYKMCPECGSKLK